MLALAARVGRLSPFGPIFGKELRVTARRRRSYLLRVLYLAALLLLLLFFWSTTQRYARYGAGVAEQAQAQEELGRGFFACFAGFTVVAMALIGPVLTATSVSSERLGRTLNVLLMTPITTWQVISGKLLSRLLVAFTLIGLSLPVLALSRLLGGIEMSQMIGAVCVAASVALHAAAIGLFFSTIMRRAFAVILLSYATIAFTQAFVPFVVIAGNNGTSDPVLWGCLNWVAAVATLVEPTSFAGGGQTFLGGGLAPWAVCSLVYLVLTIVLVGCSGLLLRRAVRAEGGHATASDPSEYIPVAGVAASHSSTAAASPAPPPPIATPREASPDSPDAPAVELSLSGPAQLTYSTPKARGPRATRPREVADNAVLWREVRRPLTSRRWQAVLFGVIALALLLVSYAVFGAMNGRVLRDADLQIGYAVVFHGLLWVLVAVVSATSVAQEKESDTWTLLLTTPLSGRTIVFGKAAGLLRRLMWPYALAAGHLALFTVTGVIRPEAFVLVLWVMIAFNAVWLATGIYLSLRLRTVTFAVILNLLLAIFAYPVVAVLLVIAGEWLAPRNDDMVNRRGGEAWSQQVAWYLPYSYLGIGLQGIDRGAKNVGNPSPYYTLPFWLPCEIFAEPPAPNDPNMWARPYHERRVGAPTYFAVVFVAGAIYLLAALGILVWTADRFDRIVGRASQRPAGAARPPHALPAAG